MDTTKATTHVSLCAGYGGIDLGLRRVIQNLRTIALCEIEAYAVANLVAKMEAGLLDPAPIWTDVKSFPYRQFHGCVHILSGGYPCQPFSAAGKRLGRNDPRHLWPWIADGIALMRPSLCFFENVEGHITLGLRDVLNDLGELGYRTTWGVFSASEVGAPHQRKRVFILAHKLGSALEGLLHDITAQGREDERGSATGCSQHRGDAWPSRPGQPQHWWEPPRTVAVLENTTGKRGGSQGGDAVHQGREAGGAGSASLPEDTEREAGASVADDQPAGGDGGSSQGMGSSELADTERNGWSTTERDAATMGDKERSKEGKQSESWSIASSFDGSSSMGGSESRKAEPTLGGDSNGSACGMDYAELCVSCDNRTDELRLLGNGVVPATAALAFKTLIKELI